MGPKNLEFIDNRSCCPIRWYDLEWIKPRAFTNMSQIYSLGVLIIKLCQIWFSLLLKVVKVLEYVEKESEYGFSQNQTEGVTLYFKTFNFVFYLHLLLHVLEITYMLSQALKKSSIHTWNRFIGRDDIKKL